MTTAKFIPELLRRLTDTIRRAIKVHSDAVNDTSHHISSRAAEGALHRHRLQCERNAAALTAIKSCFQKGTAENKSKSLTSIVQRCTQHAHRDRGIVL